MVDDPKQLLNDLKQRLGKSENDLKIMVIETTFGDWRSTWRPKRGSFCFCSSYQAYPDKLTAEGIIAREGTKKVSKWVILVTDHGFTDVRLRFASASLLQYVMIRSCRDMQSIISRLYNRLLAHQLTL